MLYTYTIYLLIIHYKEIVPLKFNSISSNSYFSNRQYEYNTIPSNACTFIY